MRISFNSGGRGAIASRIGMTFFGLVFGSIGLFVMVMAVRSGLEGRARQTWIPVACEVDRVEVHSTDDGYRLGIGYRYIYDDTVYRSEKFGSGSTFDDVATRQHMLQTYAQGSQHTCYVDPVSPRNAVLHRGSGSIWIIIGPAAFCSIFVLIGYGMVLFSWLPKRQRAATAFAKKSATSGASSARSGKIAGALFSLLFIAIGVGVTNFTFVKPLKLQQQAERWMAVDATVLDSNVREHRGDDSTTYSVYIAYEYEYRGRTWQGDRFRFTSGSSSGRSGKAQVVRQFPKGHRFQVFIDPEQPWESVVQRNAGTTLYFGLLPLIFSVAGFAILIVVLKGKTGTRRRRRRARKSKSFQSDTTDPSELETVFKPSSGHAGRILGVACFAVFWNGIVSVFVVDVVKEWLGGAKPVGTTLFMSIFVAVGIGLIVALVYNILRVFNPRIEIQSPPCILAPGVAEDIRFRIAGNVQRLRRLTVMLVGEEQATYTRGTDTRTDTESFFSALLFEDADSRINRKGSFCLSIPVDAMHSFESAHNKIIWSLKVHGDVPKWPDVEETYTLNIVPKELCS